MEMCVNGAKALIDKQVRENQISVFGVAFSSYYKSYCWTNESIAEYLKLANFDSKNTALSVLASGDHVFNLITEGITNIDTFDSNHLTEYFALGFKRAMILKYNYQEFLNNMRILCSCDTNIETITDFLYDLLPYMDKRMQIFWKQILDYNYKLQKKNRTSLNLLYILCVNIGYVGYTECNNYLRDEESYNKLKNNLSRANISFKAANAANLHTEFNNKYDFILLSNILDYFFKLWGNKWGYDALSVYEEQLQTICNDDAVIFLQYILYMAQENPTLFGESDIKIEGLKNEEVIRLANDYCGMPTGIILKRVKKDDNYGKMC